MVALDYGCTTDAIEIVEALNSINKLQNFNKEILLSFLSDLQSSLEFARANGEDDEYANEIIKCKNIVNEAIDEKNYRRLPIFTKK